MTTSRNPHAFTLSAPDPAIVLPTLASSKHGAEVRQATVGGLPVTASTLGQMRPIPSLIALRGLVGLPDPEVTPDYSALEALTRVGHVEPGVKAAPTPTPTPTPSTAAPLPTAILDATADFIGVPSARITDLLRLVQTNGTVPSSAARGVLLETATGDRWTLRRPAPAHEGMNDFVADVLGCAALVDPPRVLPLALQGAVWLAAPQVIGAIDLDDFARGQPCDADDNGGSAAPRLDHPASAGRLQGHERLAGSDPARRLASAFEQCCGNGLEAQVAFAMLVGAEDLHSGHFAVVPGTMVESIDAEGGTVQQVERTLRVDAPPAARERQRLHRIRSDYFDHQMHPAPTPRHAVGRGPNTQRLDVPRDLRCGAPYIDALLALSRLDLSGAVRIAFDEASRHWSDDVCRAFAAQAHLRLPTRRWTTGALFEECGRAYLQRIAARQASMQRYAADLAIGLASVDARSNVLRLTPCLDMHDAAAAGTQHIRPAMAIDRFLSQPETRPAIEAWLHRAPGAARQRNPSLDRHDVALRAAVAARLGLFEP